MDSTQIACLLNLSKNSTTLLKVYARNILTDAELLNYYEPVIFPDAHKSVKAGNYNNEKITDESKLFVNVFANPTKNFVILKYKLETDEKDAVIALIDAS